MDIPAPKVHDRQVAVAEKVACALSSWRRFIVGIDGVEGAGKSTFARYLGWRLGVSVIETDMYLIRGDDADASLDYRFDDLRSVICSRVGADRPVIVEGLCLLSTLDRLGLSPDFLVYIEQEGHGGGPTLASLRQRYAQQYTPRDKANEILTWVPEPL